MRGGLPHFHSERAGGSRRQRVLELRMHDPRCKSLFRDGVQRKQMRICAPDLFEHRHGFRKEHFAGIRIVNVHPISYSFALRGLEADKLKAGALGGFRGPDREADNFDLVLTGAENNGDLGHDTIEKGKRGGDGKAPFAEIEDHPAVLATERGMQQGGRNCPQTRPAISSGDGILKIPSRIKHAAHSNRGSLLKE